jgi:hypothetical protein
MGTRNLTCVQLDGKLVVAQYGQWDGNPGGQGATILDFLAEWDRKSFEANLRKCRFLTPEESKARRVSEKEFMRYPQLSRDNGAAILGIIAAADDGLELEDQSAFAADSLFCEWAYVLNLDANKLEVFKGFNKTKLTATDRFFNAQKERDNEYEPVKLVKEYSLDALPTVGQMCDDCDKQEEEETA